ncbi:mechanosensitive ion channel family protein [Robertmurraya andreesenii]|uniref:Small conductance mechanosensitive channel n=1 Tax=Anoxybacillus andreesenii TaxID=1325932 RepID=A0ABT9V0L9_9BACL|nr:mechanosensitive ion channel family protein [Robertmurraya andreesenii]MDQ0154473.1 small conductance mechanosensitive channel [Robertmurraya andreesenii]
MLGFLGFDFATWVENYDWESLIIKIGSISLKVIAIFIAYFIIKRIGRKLLEQTFNRVMNRKEISEGRALTLHRLVENIFQYALIFIVAATLLSVFNIPVASLIAGAGIVGLAVGFGAQGLVSDVVTGFFILLEKQIDVNDYVTIGNFDGIVEAVGLRTTQVRGFNGTLHFIPNREILSISNHSRGNMQALVDIRISYQDDIDRAIEIMQKACDQVAAHNPAIVEAPKVLGVQAFGTSDVVIRVIAKTVNMEQWGVERQLRKAIKDAFDENGIEIPLPQQMLVQRDNRNLQQNG